MSENLDEDSLDEEIKSHKIALQQLELQNRPRVFQKLKSCIGKCYKDDMYENCFRRILDIIMISDGFRIIFHTIHFDLSPYTCESEISYRTVTSSISWEEISNEEFIELEKKMQIESLTLDLLREYIQKKEED